MNSVSTFNDDLYIDCLPTLMLKGFRFFAIKHKGTDFHEIRRENSYRQCYQEMEKVCKEINLYPEYKAEIGDDLTIIIDVKLFSYFPVADFSLEEIRDRYQLKYAEMLRDTFDLTICDPSDRDIICCSVWE